MAGLGAPAAAYPLVPRCQLGPATAAVRARPTRAPPRPQQLPGLNEATGFLVEVPFTVQALGHTPVAGATRKHPMQMAHRDLYWNEPEYNWLANNLRVAAALAEASYDFRVVLGDGGHSSNHDGVLMPDALRWLWRPLDSQDHVPGQLQR